MKTIKNHSFFGKIKRKIMSKENLSVDKPFLSHPFSRYLPHVTPIKFHYFSDS